MNCSDIFRTVYFFLRIPQTYIKENFLKKVESRVFKLSTENKARHTSAISIYKAKDLLYFLFSSDLRAATKRIIITGKETMWITVPISITAIEFYGR